MKTGTKIAIGVSALAGLGLWYYNAATNLQISLIDPTTGLPNMQYKGADGNGISVNLRFAVTNTSMLPFFTPKFTVAIYDNTGNQIGTGTNQIMQGISGNAVSFVDVTVLIPYSGVANNLISIIMQLAGGGNVQLPTGINYKGLVNIGLSSIQMQGTIT